FCAPLRVAVAKLPTRVHVIAEPGRYIVGPSAIGVASVMGRARREGHWWYYLDDGLYGSYSGQLFDHARYPVEPPRDGEERPPAARRRRAGSAMSCSTSVGCSSGSTTVRSSSSCARAAPR